MINFEDKIKHSKEILEKLMNPEITLEESMKLYKEGMDEIKAAQKLLDDAKVEYEEIKKSFEAKDEA
ncbi:MAG: exodeoxyribonuclease VII small subunit [Campylobacterales bacterium]